MLLCRRFNLAPCSTSAFLLCAQTRRCGDQKWTAPFLRCSLTSLSLAAHLADKGTRRCGDARRGSLCLILAHDASHFCSAAVAHRPALSGRAAPARSEGDCHSVLYPPVAQHVHGEQDGPSVRETVRCELVPACLRTQGAIGGSLASEESAAVQFGCGVAEAAACLLLLAMMVDRASVWGPRLVLCSVASDNLHAATPALLPQAHHPRTTVVVVCLLVAHDRGPLKQSHTVVGPSDLAASKHA